VFQEEGDYLVELTVSGPNGSSSASTLIEVDLDPMTGIVLRPGCSGLNPPGSIFVLEGPAVIGTTMVIGVDNPLGTQPVGSVPIVWMSTLPDPAFPCGALLANWGMTAPGSSGEVLVSRTPPNPFLRRTGAPWTGAGNPAPVDVPIPMNASLIGRTYHLQGQLISTSGPIPRGLTQAFAVTFQAP
jgi:hypothetical protein